LKPRLDVAVLLTPRLDVSAAFWFPASGPLRTHRSPPAIRLANRTIVVDHVNQAHAKRSNCSVDQPRPGWAPDSLMVGIRLPDGLVVGSCNSHPGVLGSKREEPGKTGRHPVLKYRVPHGSQRGICRYGEAAAAAASWRAHDGGRQQRTACPLLYRYRLTHTYCSLARLPPTVGGRRFGLQPKRRPARFSRRTIFSHCRCRCSRMRARHPLPRVLLPHTCTQDGWFLQPKRRPARLPRRTLFSRCRCRCSRMRARLPLHILLLHTQVSR
jgi:hypothetical protein